MTRLSAVLTLALAALALAATPAGAARIYAVTSTPALISFDSDVPATSLGTVPITGLVAGDAIYGLDWRATTGTFVLFTENGSTGRLYTLDPSTGVASDPKTLTADPADATDPYTGADTTATGVDANPASTPERVRIVSFAGQNLRVNPLNGLVITDAAINPTGHGIAAVSYTNPDADPATGTTLFDYGYNSDRLYIQNPPNNGTLVEVGPSGFTAESGGPFLHQDIAADGTAFLTTVEAGVQSLFRQNLTTGFATFVGATPAGNLRGMAAVNNVVSIADATVDVSEGAGTAEVTLHRADAFDSAFVRVQVPVTVTGGSAGAGTDFGSAPSTVEFAAGARTATISVPLTDDREDESAETLTVQIGPGPNAPVVDPRAATVTIADDDPQQVTTTQTQTVTETQTITVPVPQVPPPVVLLAGRCANAQTGTNDDDALRGTTAGDTLSGGRGSDGLAGGLGDDCLRGGPGDDLLAGNAGADDLRGESGNDVLRGGRGNDVLVAGTGRDVVDCGSGRDRATVDRRDRVRGCERVVRRR